MNDHRKIKIFVEVDHEEETVETVIVGDYHGIISALSLVIFRMAEASTDHNAISILSDLIVTQIGYEMVSRGEADDDNDGVSDMWDELAGALRN